MLSPGLLSTVAVRTLGAAGYRKVMLTTYCDLAGCLPWRCKWSPLLRSMRWGTLDPGLNVAHDGRHKSARFALRLNASFVFLVMSFVDRLVAMPL